MTETQTRRRFVWRKTKHKLPKNRVWNLVPASGYYEKVPFRQAASVNRLVGTVISDCTQGLLLNRGYCLRLLRTNMKDGAAKLTAVFHRAGVEDYEQEMAQ